MPFNVNDFLTSYIDNITERIRFFAAHCDNGNFKYCSEDFFVNSAINIPYWLGDMRYSTETRVLAGDSGRALDLKIHYEDNEGTEYDIFMEYKLNLSSQFAQTKRRTIKDLLKLYTHRSVNHNATKHHLMMIIGLGGNGLRNVVDELELNNDHPGRLDIDQAFLDAHVCESSMAEMTNLLADLNLDLAAGISINYQHLPLIMNIADNRYCYIDCLHLVDPQD